MKRKHSKFLFEYDPDLHLIDELLELIKDYYNNGLRLVQGSFASMPNINSVFKCFNLDQYFVAKLSGADLKAPRHHKNECSIIEDSTNSVLLNGANVI